MPDATPIGLRILFQDLTGAISSPLTALLDEPSLISDQIAAAWTSGKPGLEQRILDALNHVSLPGAMLTGSAASLAAGLLDMAQGVPAFVHFRFRLAGNSIDCRLTPMGLAAAAQNLRVTFDAEISFSLAAELVEVRSASALISNVLISGGIEGSVLNSLYGLFGGLVQASVDGQVAYLVNLVNGGLSTKPPIQDYRRDYSFSGESIQADMVVITAAHTPRSLPAVGPASGATIPQSASAPPYSSPPVGGDQSVIGAVSAASGTGCVISPISTDMVLRGNSLFGRGQMLEAQNLYEQALLVCPYDLVALFNLGLTHARLGRRADGVAEMTRAAQGVQSLGDSDLAARIAAVIAAM